MHGFTAKKAGSVAWNNVSDTVTNAWGGDSYCVQFNGVDESARDDALPGSSPFKSLGTKGSCGAWFKTSSAADGALIRVFRYNSRYFGLTYESASGGMLKTRFRTSTSGNLNINSNASGLGDGAWHLGIITFDGSNIRWYIDNAGLDKTYATGGTWNDAGFEFTAIRMGIDPTGTAKYNGKVATAFYHSEVLSEADANKLFNAGPVPNLLSEGSYDTAGMQNNLIAWYRCGDGENDISGVRIDDQSEVAAPANIDNLVNMDASNFIEDAPA